MSRRPARARRLLAQRLHLVRAGGDRGDVPGWVMVAVMTAGLVAALLLVAPGAFKSVFCGAVEKVAADANTGGSC